MVFLTAHWLNLALRGKGKMWASSFLQPNTLRGWYCQRWKNTDLWITKRDLSCYNIIQTVLSSGTETCSKMANARWRQSFYKVSCRLHCNFHTITILIYSCIVYCYIRSCSKKPQEFPIKYLEFLLLTGFFTDITLGNLSFRAKQSIINVLN